MKRLVLLGGGHAHLGVLAELARQPIPGWEVHLVTPHPRQIYSGMLPGWVAGHYRLEQCAIPLGPLAARAGVVVHQTACSALDLSQSQGRVLCANGMALGHDALSIDTGPVPALDALPGSEAHALAVRPIEGFIAAWPALVDQMLSRCRRFDLLILGAGAAGVELALALQRRAAIEGWSHLFLTLAGTEDLPLPGAPVAARRSIARLLAQRHITWRGHCRAASVQDHLLQVEGGEPVAFDACLVATGPAAPAWPARAGLATDAAGFIRVNASLQSLSHPEVFAAGDVAAYAEPRPKSGVYAVRAAPVLAANLRAFCSGQALQAWSPQARALYLVSTGGRHALATWGRWSWEGRWVWRWKDWIDRRFVARFSSPPADPASTPAA